MSSTLNIQDSISNTHSASWQAAERYFDVVGIGRKFTYEYSEFLIPSPETGHICPLRTGLHVIALVVLSIITVIMLIIREVNRIPLYSLPIEEINLHPFTSLAGKRIPTNIDFLEREIKLGDLVVISKTAFMDIEEPIAIVIGINKDRIVCQTGQNSEDTKVVSLNHLHICNDEVLKNERTELQSDEGGVRSDN